MRELFVFAGPSISARELAARKPCRLFPPARQGDIWRALPRAPAAIALIDGYFESVPSVWHRELLSALDAGIPVFGAASMGALRAAELRTEGMIGVGTIYEWYRDGVVEDDAEVALLHGDEASGYEPFTVPLVHVRYWIARTRLESRVARRALDVAERIFYQDRTLERLGAALDRSVGARARSAILARAGDPAFDLKRLDARRCVDEALGWLRAEAPPLPSRSHPQSSLARRRRLLEGIAWTDRGEVVSSGQVLRRLRDDPRAAAWIERGMTLKTLAAVARERGLKAAPEAIAAERQERLATLGITEKGLDAFLRESDLTPAEFDALCEERALARALLAISPRLFNDGISEFEALAAEAKLEGAWRLTASRMSSI